MAPNGEFLAALLECKVLNKSVPHPYGVRSEAIRRVYFGSFVPFVFKYPPDGLWPIWVGYTFIQYLALQ